MFFSHINYFLKAKGPDRIHSPFVFDLYYHILLGDSIPYIAKKVENTEVFSKSDKFIGRNIIKIINTLKPKEIVFIKEESTQNHLYFSESINKTVIQIVSKSESQEKVKNKKVDLLIIESTLPENTTFNFEDISCVILYKTNRQQLKTWKIISSLDCYNIVINCFYFGICINRQNQVKEYFRLRF